MAQPFAAETWIRRASIPNIPLNGTYSGIVQGPGNACYDKLSRVVQSFSRVAHHFQGFASTAQISFDDGKTWGASFSEGLNNTVVFTGWSLPHRAGVDGRIHFQVRYNWTKAFLLADGTLQPGSIDLYVTAGGVTFTKLQTLHSWPGINQIGGNGGAALFNSFPSCTTPILLEGSGPDGEDAYWMATSYSFDAGGAGNRTTFKAARLWRSLDGGVTWEDVMDLEPTFGVFGFSDFFQSSSGRLFLNTSATVRWTDDVDDLLGATWTVANGLGATQRGAMVQMYGGTLLTHSQGSLIAGGQAIISCDDGVNFAGTGVFVVPVNQTGYLAKLGPTEGLLVAPGFNDPSTETSAYYTADGGETFLVSEPWLSSSIGESPVMIAIRSNGTPLVVTRSGGVFVSGDKALGIAGTRTICPLANAGLAAARPLVLCGHPLTHLCEDH